MKNKPPLVRAVDLGFGYTKLSQALIGDDYQLRCMAFPSCPALAEGAANLKTGALQKLDVVTVRVGGTSFHVGPDSLTATSGRATRATTTAFFNSQQYLALYLGALAYMDLPHHQAKIDVIGLGLPISVFQNDALRNDIKLKLTGTFEVPHITTGKMRTIEVCQVEIWPQVLGALMSLAAEGGDLTSISQQKNLVIDVGFGTLMWLVTDGMKLQLHRSGDNMGGVSSIVKSVARSLGGRLHSNPQMLDSIDAGLRSGEPVFVGGKTVDLTEYQDLVTAKVQGHLQDLCESIGDHENIHNIFLAGGGAHLYEFELKRLFEGREIRIQTVDPQFSNLKGFQLFAEALSRRNLTTHAAQ